MSQSMNPPVRSIASAALCCLALFAPLLACDAPDAEAAADDPSEFRAGDLQCLTYTAPLANTPVVADVVPGELVLFQGRYYAVPGAAANWDPVLADPEDVTVLAIGDVVRVVRPQGNYRTKMLATDTSMRLRTFTQGAVLVNWIDTVYHDAMADCLDEVAREMQQCENITEDYYCCSGLQPTYAALCANNPSYDVPNTAGEIWAETCNLAPLPTDDVYELEELRVGAMSCKFTGWAHGAAVDISNGFLTGCSAAAGTPTGCQSF